MALAVFQLCVHARHGVWHLRWAATYQVVAGLQDRIATFDDRQALKLC